MKEIELKCWPEPFNAVWLGRKTHEVRCNDRDFQVGDVLVLREWKPAHEGDCSWYSPYDDYEQQADREDVRCQYCQRGIHDPRHGEYTGASLRARVNYITSGGSFGLPPTMCVMSIEVE